MKKKSPSPLEQIPIPEVLEEQRYVDWVANYGWYVLVGLIGLFTFLFLLFRTGNNTKAETDYFNAERMMVVLQSPQAEAPADEALRVLRQILKRRPEMQTKYDAIIAQVLIAKGMTAEASPLIKRTLERLDHDSLTLYNAFAKTTLLITNGSQEEALRNSEALRDQMLRTAILAFAEEAPRSFGDILFAYNLLRIGMLQQALGLNEQEKQTWTEWKQYADGSYEFPPQVLIGSTAFAYANAVFTQGNVSLNDYIAARLAQ